MINQIPEEIVLWQYNQDVPTIFFKLQWITSWIINQGFLVLSIILGGVILLILVIANPISSKFRYLGVNLLTICLGPLFTAIIGLISQRSLMHNLSSLYLRSLDDYIASPLINWLQLVMKELWWVVLRQGLVMFFIAVALLLLAKFISKKEDQKVELDLIRKLQKG